MTTTGSTTDLAQRVADAASAPARPGKSLRDMVYDNVATIAAMLGSEEAAQRFVGLALHEVNRSFSAGDIDVPITLLGAIMQAATLKLELGTLGLCYIVPRRRKVKGTQNQYERVAQFQLGYKGIIDLARRSGEIKSLKAEAVYANDTFRMWTDETGDHLLFEPYLKGDRGEIVRYFSLAVFTNGGSHVQLASLDDIAKRRAASDMGNRDYGPWHDWPIEMAQKTCIRMQASWLPLNVEARKGIEADDAVIQWVGDRPVIEHVEVHDLPEPKSAEREQLETDVHFALEGLKPAQKVACSSWLVQTFGPVDKASDADLEKARDIASGWPETKAAYEAARAASATGGAPEPAGGQEPPFPAASEASGPPQDPTDPGPTPPADMAFPAVVDGEVDYGIPQDILDKAQRAVEAMDAKRVNEVLRQFGQPTTGKEQVRRMRAWTSIAQMAHRGDEGAKALL